MMKLTPRGRLAVLGLFLVAWPACADFESDILAARRLPGPPRAQDWHDAVPLRALVSGGAVHRAEKTLAVQEVDQDTVHRNSASCHHGPSKKAAFPVWLRAFHDDRNLYLRLTWPDLTKDVKGSRWARHNGAWKIEGGGGDGAAVVFPLDQARPFSCALVCHLDDFTVSGGRLQENARMRYAKEGQADLWLWRADEGAACDLIIDAGSIRDKSGGKPERRENSIQAAAGRPGHIFGPLDRPRFDLSGNPLPEGYRPPEGTALPAYIPLSRKGCGSNIRVDQRYLNGLWQVTFTRPLAIGDTRDMAFKPGGVYQFGLSVQDDTVRNHHIVESALKLKIIS